MSDFTVEFSSHAETEATKETRVTHRRRRARYFREGQDAQYFVHPSGVLEVITPVLDDAGQNIGEQKEFFAQGEWIRVYDGDPRGE